MNIGIIGAGAIASFLMDKINRNPSSNLRVTSILVRDKEKYKALTNKYSVQLYSDVMDFVKSEIDIVVEAANIQAIKDLYPKILPYKDFVIISVGILADENIYKNIYQLANKYKRTIYLPSGAIGGLDLLQNACAAGTVTDVSITTRKPAHTLLSNPTHEEVVYTGSAAGAIGQFPKNINVSIILSLAGIGVDRTNVTIIADPNVENNIHTIDINGDFGKATITVENQPLPENPKTSYLAAMSILGTLQRISSRWKIGNETM